jgi:hypothetical protein
MKKNGFKPNWVWLHEGLATYYEPKDAVKSPAPSPDFLLQCREAAARVCDISRMTAQRPHLRCVVAELNEHLESLARVAGVDLAAIFKLMNVTRTDGSDQCSTAGLARLAQYLGLGKEEAMFRMELALAKTTPSEGQAKLLKRLSPSSGRNSQSPFGEAEIRVLIRRCEAAYSPGARRRLREVADVFDAVYENA